MTRRQRRTNYHKRVEPRLQEITDWYRQGLIDEEVHKRLGISRSSFYQYQNEHSDFVDAINKGKATADYVVEDALNHRARGYWVEEEKVIEYEDGGTRREKVKKFIPPDTTAAIFWLKNRMRDKYKDRHDHDITQTTFVVDIDIDDDEDDE